jgi:hypothetical protein
MTDGARREQNERASGSAEDPRRIPVLFLAVVSLVVVTVVGAVALGVRSNPPLPDSMSGVRAVPGTDLVIDLDGLGLIAADVPPTGNGRVRVNSLNSPDGAIHVQYGSAEVAATGYVGPEPIAEPVDRARARAATDSTGEFELSAEFVFSSPDRDPPWRYYVVYSGTLDVVCYVAIQGGREPIEVTTPIFRAMRPARPGESAVH